MPLAPVESDRFATTQWTMVLAAGGEGSDRDAALDRLCRIYWNPVYAFIRRNGRSHDDAADLTQAFFTRAIERETFSKLERGRARFSTFLLTVLINFLRNQHARETAQKRGGGAAPYSFDELRDFAASGMSPQEAFEHNWALSVMEAAMDSLRDECHAAGKPELFAALAPFLGREPEPGEYGSLAVGLGMKPGSIAVSVAPLAASLPRATARRTFSRR